MENVHLECTIYYDTGARECVALMDEIRIESGLYAGTVFLVIMDKWGNHDMIHERNIRTKHIILNRFSCFDAHSIRRLLLELSFVNGLKEKKSFITCYSLLNC